MFLPFRPKFINPIGQLNVFDMFLLLPHRKSLDPSLRLEFPCVIVSCHSERAKRLKNLKQDPFGQAFRMTKEHCFHGNHNVDHLSCFDFFAPG